ncbi:hypothetical protein [Pelosinus sp. UFO1]|uniref:hypothetical protein n=1 Tax=Pelosinus sp. UFO1 TaxID=484770 RepID=UPI0004D18851|nr:hypothetical protein [Pelosinus sp. UFO1]AIF51851.1 hypothetical protein UFO1_2304 [Pelosinus sp. UFO1]
MNLRMLLCKKYLLLIVVILIVGWSTISLLKDTIYSFSDVIMFKSRGVETSAKVLEYKPQNIWTYSFLSRHKTIETSHVYVIVYDGHIQEIELNVPQQINSKLPVIYDKDNPAFVWQGMKDLSIWKLWKLNTRISFFPKGDVLGVVTFNFLGIITIYNLVMVIVRDIHKNLKAEVHK